MSQEMKTRAPVTDKDFGPKAKRPYEDEDEDEGQAEPAGKKKAKAPKEKKEKKPKEKKEKQPKDPKAKTRTHPFIVGVLTMLFAVLLMAVGLIMLYLDVGGIKAPFVEFFLETPLSIDIQERIIFNREQAVEEREVNILFLEDFNDQWQLDLEERERQFANELAEFERRQRLAEEEDWRRADEIAFLENLMAGRVTIEEAAATYSRMEPEEAAAIIEVMDFSAALAILGNMTSARRAPILAALQPDTAARLSEAALFDW
jgi:flagellar motility protein MotE (MotC chaperone)